MSARISNPVSSRLILPPIFEKPANSGSMRGSPIWISRPSARISISIVPPSTFTWPLDSNVKVPEISLPTICVSTARSSIVADSRPTKSSPEISPCASAIMLSALISMRCKFSGWPARQSNPTSAERASPSALATLRSDAAIPLTVILPSPETARWLGLLSCSALPLKRPSKFLAERSELAKSFAEKSTRHVPSVPWPKVMSRVALENPVLPWAKGKTTRAPSWRAIAAFKTIVLGKPSASVSTSPVKVMSAVRTSSFGNDIPPLSRSRPDTKISLSPSKNWR